MIRIKNFNFVIGKFPQMPKLLYNVLKISGGKCPKFPPWLRACHVIILFKTRNKFFCRPHAYLRFRPVSKFG